MEVERSLSALLPPLLLFFLAPLYLSTFLRRSFLPSFPYLFVLSPHSQIVYVNVTQSNEDAIALDAAQMDTPFFYSAEWLPVLLFLPHSHSHSLFSLSLFLVFSLPLSLPLSQSICLT